jgi:hypothetical protein
MRILGRLVMVVGVLLCIGGGVLAWEGWKEKKLAANSTPNAVSVDLAQLEAGSSPNNNHVKIGPHYAYYRDMVYTYEEAADHQEHPTDKVTVAYYPIVSTSHPDAQELEEMVKNSKGSKIEEKDLPRMNHFVLLVKTKKFKTIGDIQTLQPVVRVENVQGLLGNEVEPLDKGDKDLILQRFPNLNVEKVMILEPDRKPMDAGNAVTMMIGGGVMLLIGIPLGLGGLFLFIRG